MSKPPECSGCPLHSHNTSFARHDGPADAPLLVMAEALGTEEATQGKHLVGPSGIYHWKQAKRAGFTRDKVRVGNVVSCRPKNDWLAYAPWENDAIDHCKVHREPLFQEPHNAILTLGVTATREVCGYYDIDYMGSLDHWHGYVIGDGTHPWIIPTFHPANLLRGQLKYTGVYIHDLKRAWEVATQGFTRGKVDLIADPEVGWFMKWAEAVSEDTWLAVDIETPEPVNADDPDDPSWRVLYVNFSYNVDEGISVPFEGPYIPVIRGILERCRMQWYWNAFYDVPRLKGYGIKIPWYWDAKDAWHVLQSDMGADDKDPRDKSKKGTIKGNSLGFVAPFYSDLPPWKHEGALSPHYRCLDGVQTLRVAYGITEDLQKQGQWDVFARHMNLFGHRVLRPAEEIGLRVNRPKLEAYGEVLTARIASLRVEIQAAVPAAALPLKKPVWKTPPEGYQDEPPPTTEDWVVLSGEQGPGAILGRLEPGLVRVCLTCKREGVTAAHKKCPEGPPLLRNEERLLPRWTMRLPFNPSSPDQIRTLIQLAGYDTGKAKKAKTDKMTTEAAALEKLARKIPVLGKVLDLREVEKTDGTYVSGVLGKRDEGGVRGRGRLDEQDRVHSTFLERPSTLRLSSANPNLQNVVHGDEDEDDENLPAWDPSGFRRAIEAADGCELWEFDYSAIEAVLTGWFCGDPNYIRLAQAGVHAYLTAVGIGAKGIPTAAELKGWSTSDLKKALKPFKSHPQYPIKKRVVHGVSYGLTSHGMSGLYPDIFPSAKAAQKEIDFFFSVCPMVQKWQNHTRNTAARLGFLGGQGAEGEAPHPYHYKHWFFEVMTWDTRNAKWRAGADANRVVAFKPQSTARGVLTEAALDLHDPGSLNYIGDLYYGKTPTRALVHDSLLEECPVENGPILHERVVRAMTRPVEALPCPPEWGLGEYLTIGVAVKKGKNWAPATKHNPEGMREVA